MATNDSDGAVASSFVNIVLFLDSSEAMDVPGRRPPRTLATETAAELTTWLRRLTDGHLWPGATVTVTCFGSAQGRGQNTVVELGTWGRGRSGPARVVPVGAGPRPVSEVLAGLAALADRIDPYEHTPLVAVIAAAPDRISTDLSALQQDLLQDTVRAVGPTAIVTVLLDNRRDDQRARAAEHLATLDYWPDQATVDPLGAWPQPSSASRGLVETLDSICRHAAHLPRGHRLPKPAIINSQDEEARLGRSLASLVAAAVSFVLLLGLVGAFALDWL